MSKKPTKFDLSCICYYYMFLVIDASTEAGGLIELRNSGLFVIRKEID